MQGGFQELTPEGRGGGELGFELVARGPSVPPPMPRSRVVRLGVKEGLARTPIVWAPLP